MIDPNMLKTIIARLKIYEASLQTAPLSDAAHYGNAMVPSELDHSELQTAIADLEAAIDTAQTQIVPGSLVRQKVTGEIGRVVTIFNTDGFDDTYVAFWGQTPPDSPHIPTPRPYILRYCLSSLELFNERE